MAARHQPTGALKREHYSCPTIEDIAENLLGARMFTVLDANFKEELEAVLGMATYLGKLAPNLSDVTAPLRDLTTKVKRVVFI